jgi:hypothetical protein
MEADEFPYVFALGSVLWELGDRSQPISGTLSGVGRVIVTIEYTKQKISSSWNKGGSPGINHSHEHRLGTSAPKRASSSSGPVEGQGSIWKPPYLE